MNIEDLLYEEESSSLDFKQEQYKFAKSSDYEKAELLKDILAFVNAWRREDAYILIGVRDVKGGRAEVYGVDNDLDDSRLQEFINSKTNKPVHFEYKNKEVDGKNIAYIKIPLHERPIYIKKDYGKLRRNIVYIRRGSATAEAEPEEVITMRGDVTRSSILKFQFADNSKHLPIGSTFKTSTCNLLLANKSIPDYKRYSNRFPGMPGQLINMASMYNHENHDYYRELVEYYQFTHNSTKVSFSMTNMSEITETDIKVEIILDSKDAELVLTSKKKHPRLPSITNDVSAKIQSIQSRFREIQTSPDIIIKKIDDTWYLCVLFNKVQPGQSIYTHNLFYLSANKTCEVSFKYEIFADNLVSPIKGLLTSELEVVDKNISLKEIEEMNSREAKERLKRG